MVDPAENPIEFEKRLSATPNVARVERESNPEGVVTQDAICFRVFLSADMAVRMQEASDPFEVIDSISRRFRQLGAYEIKKEGAELIVAYK
jgi:hypothetical protein